MREVTRKIERSSRVMNSRLSLLLMNAFAWANGGWRPLETPSASSNLIVD